MTKGERMFKKLGYERVYCPYSDGILFKNKEEDISIEFSIGLSFVGKFFKSSTSLQYMLYSAYSIDEIKAIKQVYKENIWQIKLWGNIKYGNPKAKYKRRK